MTQNQIILTQKVVGTLPDGWWGPKSIAACKEYLRRLMPVPNPWPKTDQVSLTAFYGHAGDEDKLIAMPVPSGVTMRYEGTPIRSLRCHERVAVSLSRALSQAFLRAPLTVQIYDGCYNNRPMTGGSLPSLHARGAAIDLDAEHNGYRDSWPIHAMMPIEVMECFAREGWISAGAFWGYDAMHFQATQ